jgi:hypothetical protein
MSGCELPVVIVSGSGNQGITASLPVIRYALRIGAERETLHRALAVSALVTLQQKSGIGKLSAYCGAVCAGVGAGAGIAWLLDGSYHAVAHTIINAAAIISGTLCDGAKPHARPRSLRPSTPGSSDSRCSCIRNSFAAERDRRRGCGQHDREYRHHCEKRYGRD